MSRTVTVPATASPSVVSKSGLLGGLVDATPERLSSAVNGTATSVLFQPAALAAGKAVPKVRVGSVLSSFTTTDWEAVRPSQLVAEHVRVMPANGVSAPIWVDPHPDACAIPDSGSPICQVTFTSAWCHPAAFGG